MFTLTFTKVFGPNTKDGANWTRWDYRTADGLRRVHFAPTAEIPLNTAVHVELKGENKIVGWSLAGSGTAEVPQQATGSPQNGSQRVTGASGRDFEAEARGKTRCALMAALLPALFTAQVAKGGDPSPENARVLLDWAFNYVFTPDDVPF